MRISAFAGAGVGSGRLLHVGVHDNRSSNKYCVVGSMRCENGVLVPVSVIIK